MKPALLAIAAVSLFAASPAFASKPGSGLSSCQGPMSVGGPGIERRNYRIEPYDVCFAISGSVCVVKDPAQDAHDPSNWSDLLIFFEPGAPWPGNYAINVVYISEQSTPGGVGGIQQDDLDAAFGDPAQFNLANVVGTGNTEYVSKNPAGPITTYAADSFSPPMHYLITSNPGTPVPTFSSTLARLKAIYR